MLAAAALLPTGYLLSLALPVLGQGGWLAHFAGTTLPEGAWNSALVALQAAAWAALLGAVPAVAVSRFEFAGRRLLTPFALLPLLFAPSVVASTWMVKASADFFTSRAALALYLGATSAPYVFVVFRIAAARMPGSFAEMAAALGAGPLERWRRVHGPAYAVPAAASLMIVFAQSVGDYASADRLGIQTLSVALMNLWLASQSTQVAAIVSTVLIVPTLALVAAAAWAATSMMSQNPVPPAAAAASRRPLAGPAAWGLVALGSLPALGFAATEWHQVQWTVSRWARTRFADIPGDTWASFGSALIVVALVLAVCAAVALVLRAGGPSRTAERLPWLFLGNYFLPSLVLALAFVMMTRDGSWLAAALGPWRDTRLPIVVPDALRFMPFAMLPMLDALRRTPPAMVEAARACGRGPLAARAVAFSGHLLPALLLGAGLVFVECVKELDVSLTLQPFGYSTLALKIYAFARNQNADRAAVWALISQALMLLPLLLLWWRMERLDGARRH